MNNLIIAAVGIIPLKRCPRVKRAELEVKSSSRTFPVRLLPCDRRKAQASLHIVTLVTFYDRVTRF